MQRFRASRSCAGDSGLATFFVVDNALDEGTLMSTKAVIGGVVVFLGTGMLLAWLMFAVAHQPDTRDGFTGVDAGPASRRLPAQPTPVPPPSR